MSSSPRKHTPTPLGKYEDRLEFLAMRLRVMERLKAGEAQLDLEREAEINTIKAEIQHLTGA